MFIYSLVCVGGKYHRKLSGHFLEVGNLTKTILDSAIYLLSVVINYVQFAK